MSNDGKGGHEVEGKEWYLSKRQGLVRSGMGIGILAVKKKVEGDMVNPSSIGAGISGNCTFAGSQGTPRLWTD